MNSPAGISPAERRVLDYLKCAGRCEVRAIARSLHVTPMAVRHHLAVLEKAGLVKTALARRGVGRPRHVYSLSEAAEALFPKEYGELVGRLLRYIAELGGEAKVAHFFERMKEEAVARYAPRMVGKGLEERVAELAKIQSESGYMADWQRLDKNTFELSEHNCAIWQVARNCPPACECELAMMQVLLGARVSRKEHLATGDSCCRYLIQRMPGSARPRRRRGSARAKASG
ncbi:MAG: helix-turn-helix transcriptional regulator [Terriglobia bacterium]